MHTGIYLDFTIANQSWCHPYEKNFTTLRLILYTSVGLKIMYFLNPSLPAKHTPLLQLRPQGITKILQELIRCRKVSIKNIQLVIWLWLCNLMRFPGPLSWGRAAIHVKCHLTGLFLVHAFQNSVIWNF